VRDVSTKSAWVFGIPVVQSLPLRTWQPTTWLSNSVTLAVPEASVHDVLVPLSDKMFFATM